MGFVVQQGADIWEDFELRFMTVGHDRSFLCMILWSLREGEGSRSLQVMIWSTLGAKAGGPDVAHAYVGIL